MQTITSAQTSIKQVPAIFRKVQLSGVNLDIGGGKYDLVNESFDSFTNLVYDPYNRTEEHNNDVLEKARKQCNSITISNVLNVINSDKAIYKLLQFAKSFDAPVYITVYEGDKSGVGMPTKCGYQRNMKTKDCLPLIKEVFPNAFIKNNVIYC